MWVLLGGMRSLSFMGCFAGQLSHQGLAASDRKVILAQAVNDLAAWIGELTQEDLVRRGCQSCHFSPSAQHYDGDHLR